MELMSSTLRRSFHKAHSCAQGLLHSVREGRWTHGLLLEPSPSHEMEAVFFSLGGALLVYKSTVRPLFGLVVPSSALGETWRAPSQARNVLKAREKSVREASYTWWGQGSSLYFQGKGGSPKGHHRRERSKRSSLSNQRLLVVTWTPRLGWTVQHRACDSPNLFGQHPHPSLTLQRFRKIRPIPVPLFLAGSGGVLACVPVAGEDDKITDAPFDESCSS